MKSELVMHDDSFLSLLKAAVLKEVRGYAPVHEKASIIASGVNANNFTIKRLMLEWEWVNEKPHEVHLLSNAVKLAVLHKNSDYDLVIKVLIQALHKGYDYVLSQSSPEAKRFCSIVRQVRNEFYRARLFTKFNDVGRYIIGSFNFNHNIIGLVLEFFQKRFNKQLLINSNDSYHALINNEIVEFQPLIAK